jgi:hypothetical protein
MSENFDRHQTGKVIISFPIITWASLSSRRTKIACLPSYCESMVPWINISSGIFIHTFSFALNIGPVGIVARSLPEMDLARGVVRGARESFVDISKSEFVNGTALYK